MEKKQWGQANRRLENNLYIYTKPTIIRYIHTQYLFHTYLPHPDSQAPYIGIDSNGVTPMFLTHKSTNPPRCCPSSYPFTNTAISPSHPQHTNIFTKHFAIPFWHMISKFLCISTLQPKPPAYLKSLHMYTAKHTHTLIYILLPKKTGVYAQ